MPIVAERYRPGLTIARRPVASGATSNTHNARGRHDHRLPRPLHHRAQGAARLPQGADRRRQCQGQDDDALARVAENRPTTRSARASKATSSSCSASAAPTSPSSRRAPPAWATTSATKASAGRMVADLQRPDPPRRLALPEELHRRLPVAAIAGVSPSQLRRRARALRQEWASSAATSIPIRRAAIGIRRR